MVSDNEEKLRKKIAKQLGIKPSEVKLDTFSGQTIIDKSVLSKEECEELLSGQFVNGVGCITTEEEQPDGSKVYKKPSIKVYRKKPVTNKNKTGTNDAFVTEEDVV